MCILFIGLKLHKNYPLIVCANRDEFHHRPTMEAHFWPERPQMLAGKDLKAGGSWLGVNKQGKFAALTNIFRKDLPQHSNWRTRGELVVNMLDGEQGIDHDWLVRHSDDYQPFNLIYGYSEQLYCYSSLKKTSTLLSAGVHGISNGSLDDKWPKMSNGTLRLETLTHDPAGIDSSRLLALLTDETQAADEFLPQRGMGLLWERQLSAIFIRHETYGTRSSNVILQGSDNKLHFTEVRYNHSGHEFANKTTAFTLESI